MVGKITEKTQVVGLTWEPGFWVTAYYKGKKLEADTQSSLTPLINLAKIANLSLTILVEENIVFRGRGQDSWLETLLAGASQKEERIRERGGVCTAQVQFKVLEHAGDFMEGSYKAA